MTPEVPATPYQVSYKSVELRATVHPLHFRMDLPQRKRPPQDFGSSHFGVGRA
jgi:hypothetical protein